MSEFFRTERPPANAVDHYSKVQLEAMVDKHTLADVLIALAEICIEKGEHLSYNWADAVAASNWVQAGRYLNDRAARAKVVEFVSR